MSFLTFYKLLNNLQKLNFWILIFLSIIIIFLELLSIGLVIPLISIILDPVKFIGKLHFLTTDSYPYIQNILISESFIYYFLIFFVLLFSIKNILVFIINYYQCKFVESIETSFSEQLIFKYLSQKFPFFSQNTSSSLISKLSVDFLNFTRGFVSQTITISSEILIIFSFTIFIIFLDLHKVGFIFLLFFIVGAILMKVIGNLSNSWGKKRKLYDHLKINLLNNTFQNIKSIIIDNKREFVTKNFNSYVKELASLQKKIVAIKVLPRSIFEIFGILSLSVVIMIMTVFDFDKNDILTSTGFFIAVAYRIVPSFQKIIYSYQTISLAKVVLNSIHKDLHLNSKISSDNNRIPFKDKIELKNIYFKYSGRNKNVIEGLNLNIIKGNSIGIFGVSGEGKSTLVDIMSCLLPPDKGNIQVDGIKINNEDLIRKWQNQISYVTQNTILLNDTIKNNIIFSSNSKDIDNNLLEKIIESTQLNNFISSLPNKINTNVGEMGQNISGGQRKRIGIARALYKNPELLILDEATNGLDKETEDKILSMVYSLKKKISLILISHDINVLKNADEIFEFSRGKIAKKNDFYKEKL